MNIHNLARDRSFDEMSAVGKNLGLAAIIATGGHDTRLLNLPNIIKSDFKNVQ